MSEIMYPLPEASSASTSRKQRLLFVLTILSFIGMTVGLTILTAALSKKFNFPVDRMAWLAYVLVFVSTLISSATILTPAPVGLSLMLPAAVMWNPLLVGIAAGVGSSIGELSSYWAGRVGSKILIRETFMCRIHQKLCLANVSHWINRYGVWAVGGLALQPVLPFDVAGLIAGAARMPLVKFFIALLVGKTIRSVVIALAAAQILWMFPFWRIG